VLEQFDVRSPDAAAAPVPLAATDLSAGSGGIVFRAARDIYVLGPPAGPKLVARTAARPIGLTIEGRRIAWAENLHGKGRIEAMTLR
jgi:hypothetical protein